MMDPFFMFLFLFESPYLITEKNSLQNREKGTFGCFILLHDYKTSPFLLKTNLP